MCAGLYRQTPNRPHGPTTVPLLGRPSRRMRVLPSGCRPAIFTATSASVLHSKARSEGYGGIILSRFDIVVSSYDAPVTKVVGRNVYFALVLIGGLHHTAAHLHFYAPSRLKQVKAFRSLATIE